jgi:hypothetical protein
MADAYVLAMWCPVFSRHDSYSRFRTELENLFGHYSVSSLLWSSPCLIGASVHSASRGLRLCLFP